jgi:hypothetical protein
MKGLIGLVLAFGVCSVSAADEVPISKTESLFFTKPAGFTFEVAREPDDAFRPSMKFSHFGKSGLKDFGFKLFINKGREGELASEAEVKEFAAVDCEGYKEGSVEGRVSMQRVPGANVGYYCAFTDASMPPNAAPLPGQFRVVSVGYVKSGAFGFNVIAYSNEKSGPLYSAFLATLASLKVKQN